MTRLGLWFMCVLAIVSLPRAASAADRPWVEVKSAHFTVLSDAGEKTARDIAWQFEQVSALLRTLWPWATTDIGKPMVVLAPRDEEGMKALAPQYWEPKNGVRPASVSVEGPDRNYVALRADARADERQGQVNPYLTAYWSYTSLILGHGCKHRLPPGLSRGMSSVLSNTVVRPQFIQIGRVIPLPDLFGVAAGAACLYASTDVSLHAGRGRRLGQAGNVSRAHHVARRSDVRACGILCGRATAGLIADSESKQLEALAAYRKAIELGSTNFYIHYRWASLSRRPDADSETIGAIARALQRTNDLNAAFAPAYMLRGEAAAALGQSDQALALLRKAISLEPSQLQPRPYLARVLWTAGRHEEARSEARDALALASTGEERALRIYERGLTC